MRLRRGFTLLELMVATTIFVLVIGSIYFTLRAGVESFHQGEQSMEIFQGVRVGLSRVGRDVRRAISPESNWGVLRKDDALRNPLPSTGSADQDNLGLEQEEEENDIVFVGDSKQMKFVVLEIMPEGDPVFDLREIQYSVDSEEKVLIRQDTKSIVRERVMEWRAERLMTEEDETDFRVDYGPAAELKDVKTEIARNIDEMNLAYFDGQEWRDSWDSSQYVEEETPDGEVAEEDYEQGSGLPDEEPRRLGLPDAVRIALKLTNHDVVELVTEVPAKEIETFNNETRFGSYSSGGTR